MDFKDFIEYELFQAIAEDPTRAFPQLHFERKGDKWKSRYHLDGARDSGGQYVTTIPHNGVFHDYGRGGVSKNFLTLYLELNGSFSTKEERIRAAKELADLYGLHLPDYDPQKEGEYQRKQEIREKHHAIFREALWSGSPEAEATLQYLRGRGWDDGLIRAAGLGHIDTNILNSFSEEERAPYNIPGIGTTNTIAIPYWAGSVLKGFTFRRNSDTDKRAPKYLNTNDTVKTALLNIGIGVSDVVIAEGWLDSLHAQVLGRTDVVAWAQAQPDKRMIEEAIRRGVKRFTLLLDMDKAGQDSIKPAIKAIQEIGGAESIYVATIPEGEGKDLDEYLLRHTIEEYDKEIKGKAVPYSLYVLETIKDKYRAKEAEAGELTDKDRADFFGEVERLINSPYTVPMDRQRLIVEFGKETERLQFRMEDFVEFLATSNEREQQQQLKRQTETALGEATGLLKDGKVKEAIERMGKAAETLKVQERATEYERVFLPSTPEEYATLLSEIKEGIPTGFKFEQGIHYEPLTLNSGLTFVCANRGHGKTSFLNNIALNDARRNITLGSDKKVLYFSYELDKRRLILDLMNTFVNDAGISQNPLNSILKYFKGEKAKYFTADRRTDGQTHYEYFLQQQEIFRREYLSSGALTIVQENYKVESLLDAIKYYLSIREASIICIDYAQLIYSEDYSRLRTEEIKRIVNDIKDFSNKEGIPFLMAAQFNREVDSPISVDTRNIGEGGDIERIADTCIGLFNLKELHPLPKNQEEEKAAKKLLQDLGVATYAPGDKLEPIDGKVFARLMKRRYGYYPLDIVLDWEGRTKYFKPNVPGYAPDDEPGWLKRAIEEEDDKDIF